MDKPYVKFGVILSRNCPHYPNCDWRRRKRPPRDALPHADERRRGGGPTSASPKGLDHRDALGLRFHVVVFVVGIGTAENAAGAEISLHLPRAPQHLLLFLLCLVGSSAAAAAVFVFLLSTDCESAAVVKAFTADAKLNSAQFIPEQGFLERGVEQGAKRGVQHEDRRRRFLHS